jgi:hypothetical protein
MKRYYYSYVKDKQRGVYFITSECIIRNYNSSVLKNYQYYNANVLDYTFHEIKKVINYNCDFDFEEMDC